MKRQPLYFAMFILTILMCSSLYLTWSVDRGMGSIVVERFSLEREPGRPVEVLVYSPRSEALGGDLEPTPIILSIHGIAGSKESMYAFNIELARRNFTVVSIDLPGHGDSTLIFSTSDIEAMAQDAYFALRFVQTSYPRVDNESYGVLLYSFGFQVGMELLELPIPPMSFACVGDINQMALDQYSTYPGNLLLALSRYDSNTSIEAALDVIQEATGNSSAESGVTYGFISNQTAYRLAITPVEHTTVVGEAVSWFIKGLQEEAQLSITLDPENHIYQRKTIGTYASTTFLLVSTFPIMLLVYCHLPEQLKPRKTLTETQPYPTLKIFGISSLLGLVTITIFLVSAFVGFNLETNGVYLLNSMFTTGLLLFFIIGTIGLIVTKYLLIGKSDTFRTISSISLENLKFIEIVKDLTKSLVIVVVPIIWIMFWLAFSGVLGSTLALIKWPVGVRAINVVIITLTAIPFVLVDATWIRCNLFTLNEWKFDIASLKTILIAYVAKFLMVSIFFIIYVLIMTAFGLMSGQMIIIVYLLFVTIMIQVLSTTITAYTAHEFENVWSAVILGAFLFSIVLVSGVPLL